VRRRFSIASCGKALALVGGETDDNGQAGTAQAFVLWRRSRGYLGIGERRAAWRGIWCHSGTVQRRWLRISKRSEACNLLCPEANSGRTEGGKTELSLLIVYYRCSPLPLPYMRVKFLLFRKMNVTY